MDEKQLKELRDKYSAVVKQRNDLSEEINVDALKIIEAKDYIEKELTEDHDDFKAKNEELEAMLETQKERRSRIVAFDDYIGSIKPAELAAVTDFADIAKMGDADDPITPNAIQGGSIEAIVANATRDFAKNIGEDVFNFIRS